MYCITLIKAPTETSEEFQLRFENKIDQVQAADVQHGSDYVEIFYNKN